MSVKNISSAILGVGVDDTTIDLFESQYPVPTGVSYNSYVIRDEKIAILDILLLEGLGAAAVVLGLRDGTGHDADLVGHGVIIGLALLFAAGDQGERHDESQQQRNYFFHVYLLIPLP